MRDRLIEEEEDLTLEKALLLMSQIEEVAIGPAGVHGRGMVQVRSSGHSGMLETTS